MDSLDKKHAKSIATYDFFTGYNKLPQNLVVQLSLIDS